MQYVYVAYHYTTLRSGSTPRVIGVFKSLDFAKSVIASSKQRADDEIHEDDESYESVDPFDKIQFKNEKWLLIDDNGDFKETYEIVKCVVDNVFDT